MTGSDSPDDDDERPPADASDRDGFTGIRLDVGLTAVTDLVDSLLDADVSRPTQDQPRRRPDGPGKVGRKRDDHVSPARDADAAPDAGESTEESVDTDEFHVRTDESDDALTVVADLPGISEDDLSVGLAGDGDALVVAVHDQVVDRVSLPWDPVAVTRVWFNNGVLEVVVRPVADEDDEPEG